MFIINRETGAGPVHNESAYRALQQKILRQQHLLNHSKAFPARPETGYLHCKKTLRAQEASFVKEGVLLPIFLIGKIQERVIDRIKTFPLPFQSLSSLALSHALQKALKWRQGKRMRLGESNSLGFESQFCHLGPSDHCQHLV